MSELKVVKANKRDMQDVAKFIRESAHWYEPFLSEDDLSEHYVDQSWIESNYPAREFYLGINSKGIKVGTISVQFYHQYTYLGYIYLGTSFVGKGYGHGLLNFAKQRSKEEGMKGMCLLSHPKAKWAVRAYEKYGFQKKFEDKNKILKWNKEFLRPYYEEGFDLYTYEIYE